MRSTGLGPRLEMNSTFITADDTKRGLGKSSAGRNGAIPGLLGSRANFAQIVLNGPFAFHRSRYSQRLIHLRQTVFREKLANRGIHSL